MNGVQLLDLWLIHCTIRTPLFNKHASTLCHSALSNIAAKPAGQPDVGHFMCPHGLIMQNVCMLYQMSNQKVYMQQADLEIWGLSTRTHRYLAWAIPYPHSAFWPCSALLLTCSTDSSGHGASLMLLFIHTRRLLLKPWPWSSVHIWIGITR